MARVVVVGGGLAGLASALRLAKLGHEVTLLERSGTWGGPLAEVRAGEFAWDGGATYTLLPAVVRDLFRKTGRPIERELELVPLDLVREHRFADGSSLRLTSGRAAQLAAFERLGIGLGRRWVDHVAAYAEDWAVLRRGYLENPWRPGHLPGDLAARLDSRETLRRRLRRTLRDERLRLVAAHPFQAEGHHPRNVPAWAGVSAYVEQQWGAWTVDGGMARLIDALVARLSTRGVTALAGTGATDLVVRGGRVVAVATPAGAIDTDLVVCAVDPRRLPALAAFVERTVPASPPAVVHLGLSGAAPDLPHELVLHGDPTLVVRTGGRAPGGSAAVTVHGRGRLGPDILGALAGHGIDLRPQVVERIDLSPRDQLERWGGSPLGVRWRGRATVRRRLGPRSPIPGVYVAGAHATPGAGIPYVGLSAALVAAEVGPA